MIPLRPFCATLIPEMGLYPPADLHVEALTRRKRAGFTLSQQHPIALTPTQESI
jgi:hypothetical protein